MKQLKLNQFVRPTMAANYHLLKSIEQRIEARIRSEFSVEINAIRSDNERLLEEERLFQKNLIEFLKAFSFDVKFKVSVQIGKDSSVTQTYIGNIVKHYGRGCFDFVSDERNTGKPFTIGASCLQSIEVIS